MTGRRGYTLRQKLARGLAMPLLLASALLARPLEAQPEDTAGLDAGHSGANSDGGDSPTALEPRMKLKVVVAGNSPFVENSAAGTPTGLSVDTFREAARIMQVDYELISEVHVDDALLAVSRGTADMAVGPISITAKRAQMVQFSQPYYQSSLGILAPAADTLLSKVRPFLTKTFLAGTGGLLLVLLGVGSLVWVVERKHNPEQFPAHALKGIGNGVWLALVTMTTVGYGDRVPLSAAGRVVCGVWMLLSMIVASSLTAFMATALTLSQLDGPRLSEASDMKNRPVAVVAGTTSESFALTHRARIQPQDTLEEAISLVEGGTSDAVVGDRPMLQHWLSNNPSSDLQLSEANYLPHGYGFAISRDALLLRSKVDLALLRLIAEGRISQLSAQWVGSP